MALDWLKVCKDTPCKPEITILSNLLGITHEAAFLQWFLAYAWADGITEDGVVPFLSLENGDSLSRCCPGTFGALASERIRWIEPIDGDWSNGFRFAKWDRHNGSCAKRRSLDAEKKRKQRAMSPVLSQDCPQKNGTKKGLEKRREEKSNTQSCRFVKPGVEDVRAYCTERKNKVDPQRFIDHYESNGWRVGKSAMKDWKAAVRTWEQNAFGDSGNRAEKKPVIAKIFNVKTGQFEFREEA